MLLTQTGVTEELGTTSGQSGLLPSIMMGKSLKSLVLNLSKEKFLFSSLLNLCYHNYEKQLIFTITYGQKL